MHIILTFLWFVQNSVGIAKAVGFSNFLEMLRIDSLATSTLRIIGGRQTQLK